MIYSINYNAVEKELQSLKHELRDCAAHVTDEEWTWVFARSLEEVRKSLASMSVLDLACMDISRKQEAEQAEKMRSLFPQMMMLVIADENVSPMQYLRPSIRPSSLLLRPFGQEQAQRVIQEFLTAWVSERDRHPEESYVVENREGKTILPYQTILYFEARQKKVFVRVGAVEYDTYETMDHLEEIIPERFVRCHRSFIVNTERIRKISFRDNLIMLTDGSQIPVSRSYRKVMREYR